MTRKERHPSLVRLLDALKPHGVSGPSSLALAMSESPQVVTNWSYRGVSPAAAIKAEEKFGVSSLWILKGRAGAEPVPHQPTEEISARWDGAFLVKLLEAIPVEHQQRAYLAATQTLIGFLSRSAPPASVAPALSAQLTSKSD